MKKMSVKHRIDFPKSVTELAHRVSVYGGRAVVVGGSVRDHLLGKDSKDIDIEVFGIESIEVLANLLRPLGVIKEVGKSFGVLKLATSAGTFDVSLPRSEEKISKGHRGFKVSTDGSMDFAQAARRRDFTINAIGYDPIAQTILDPYGGIKDLQAKLLRHIDDATFVEDPLRIYRAVQFSARFEMKIAPKTDTLCRRMVGEGMLEELAKERVFEELKKLLLKSPKPSVGFELMRVWGIIRHYFPELHALIGVPQDKRYHPEGDVWVHTMMALDAMAQIIKQEGVSVDDAPVYLFGVLCHDLGKPATTTVQTAQGETIAWQEATAEQIDSAVRIHAPGHEEAGLEPARSLMRSLTNQKTLLSRILPLIKHHLKPSQFYRAKAKDAAIRRLSLQVPIVDLVRVAKADFLGRTTPEALSGRFEAGEWLLKRAEALEVRDARPKPLLQGRDLIDMGFAPSPLFGKVLREVYEYQIDGKIATKSQAYQLAKHLFRRG